MTVKVQMVNGGSDSVDFVNAAGTTLAQVKGYDDTSNNGHLEFYTDTSGTLSEKVRVQNGLHIQQDSSSSNRLVFRGQPSSSYRWNIDNYGSSNQMRFFREDDSNAANGAVMMTIDNSGNVGIGTSSPSNYGKFAVIGNVSYAGKNVAGFFQSNASGSSVLNIQDTTSGYGVGVGSVGNNLALYYSSGGNLIEGARIDSSGNLLVGTTTSGGVGISFVPGGVGAPYCTFNKSYNGGAGVLNCQYNGTGVGGISMTNTATAFNTSSDYRLKDNIAPMTGALSVVAQLKPVTYNWKLDGSEGQGFIAHELQAVVPDCVTGEKDAVDADGNPVYQGIDTSFLVATLTAAIQEQQALISSQAAAIQTLTERITALENKQ